SREVYVTTALAGAASFVSAIALHREVASSSVLSSACKLRNHLAAISSDKDPHALSCYRHSPRPCRKPLRHSLSGSGGSHADVHGRRCAGHAVRSGGSDGSARTVLLRQHHYDTA